MSIDQGKLLNLIARLRPNVECAPWVIEELCALAQPAEAVDGGTDEYRRGYADGVAAIKASPYYDGSADTHRLADAAQGAVVDVPRWDFEQHADGHSLKLYPMRVADGRWVKWSDIQNRAFFEALVRSKEATHPQAAPAQGDGE